MAQYFGQMVAQQAGLLHGTIFRSDGGTTSRTNAGHNTAVSWWQYQHALWRLKTTGFLRFLTILYTIYIPFIKHVDGPGSNPARKRVSARPAGPGAHPASCKIGTGSFPGVKCGRSVLLTTHALLVPRSWKSRAIPLPTLSGPHRACNGITLHLPYKAWIQNVFKYRKYGWQTEVKGVVELHIKAANCEGRGLPSVQFCSRSKYKIWYTQLTERIVTYINVKCLISGT